MSLRQGFFKPVPHPIEQELSKISQGKAWSAPSSLVNQYSKEKLFETIKELDRQMSLEGNDTKKKILDGKMKALGVHLMQKDIEQISEQGNNEIIKQFGDFLLGKSTYNVNPNYRRLVPWGQRRLYGPGIDEYLKGVLSKKLDFDAKIATMRRSGFFPSDIEEAWFYFIFIVLQKQTPTDMYMKNWESFYPSPLLPPHMYSIDEKNTVGADGKPVPESKQDGKIPKPQTNDNLSDYKISPQPQLEARYIGVQDGADPDVKPFDQTMEPIDPTKDEKNERFDDLMNTKKTAEQELIEEQAKSQTEALTKLTTQMDQLIMLLTPKATVTPSSPPPPYVATPTSAPIVRSALVNTPDRFKSVTQKITQGPPPSSSEREAEKELMTIERKREETAPIDGGGDTTDVGQIFVPPRESSEMDISETGNINAGGDTTDVAAKQVSFMAHGTPVSFVAKQTPTRIKTPDYYEIRMASVYSSRNLSPQQKQRKISRYASDKYSPSVRASANKYLANLL